MLNFDMVGRLLGTAGAGQAGGTQPTVVVQGSDSAAEWAELVAPSCQRASLTCKLGGDGYGPSDMTPFYAAGIPVLFFFTGAHADYHRPSDTADKINAMGIVQVAGLATGIVSALGDRLQKQPQGLTFKKPTGPAPRGGDRGYGAYLGTIPDYSAMQGAPGGVKLSGARPGSPAEQAGIVAEDVLVGLGESKINTLEDMAFALRKYKPGQTVDVIVLRKGQKQTLRATLTQRQ
jgi:membrane-associated protease RseP (regulator of RpoE activity)